MLTALGLAHADFGAYYTKVDSGEVFEEFSRTGPEADIVVRDIGPEHGRFVFWRGSSYLPYFEVKDGSKQEIVVIQEGRWPLSETVCFGSKTTLYHMPPTRYMNARWYLKFLQTATRKAN